MGTLTNKRILLGITGGIAAYKCADLTRRLRDAGAEVRVVMTQAATQFVTPLTMQTVSDHPVYQHVFDDAVAPDTTMAHIELARWADLILVAPASANSLAKLAQGRADDLLTTLCLATDAVVAVAPAMNRQMWQNPATQDNLAALRRNGIAVFGPAEGIQACGETGPGRMLEPAELIALAADLFATGLLSGLRVIVTAGPTWESIDPVRGITNRSSGKMGYAVAHAAVDAGAETILVSGPTHLDPPERVDVVRVTSAQQMLAAVHDRIGEADIFIGVAAAADYRPAEVSVDKIKKDAETMTLKLIRNPDILASVAAIPQGPFTVGFAAETTDLIHHARKKLERKGVDMIAANKVGVPETGFDSDDNALALIDDQGIIELPRMHKSRLARRLIREIARSYHAKDSTENTRRAHRR